MKPNTGGSGGAEVAAACKAGAAQSVVALSSSSCPKSTSASSAAPAGSLAKTPIVSSEGDCVSTPRRGIAPKVGLYPVTPQKDAGRITDPPVWVPMASGTIPSATAAAEPCDDPPGVCARLCGFAVLPGCMKASSVVTVLPIRIAPSLRSRSTTKASRRGTRPAS